MLTVKEAVGFLDDHQITSSEQMVRRWLRQGRIKGISSKNRKTGWRICTMELTRFIDSLSWEYKEEIDNRTKNEHLLDEINVLKKQIQELENEQLRDKLGIPPF